MTPSPVLAAEVPFDYNEEFPEHFFEAVDPGFHVSEAQNLDQILVAHLAQPQQVRCCYTCWRPGNFFAECPLIPEPEMTAIARRKSDVMQQRDRRPPYGRGLPQNRTYGNPISRPGLGISSVATPASSPQEPIVAVEELTGHDQLEGKTRLFESQ
jgi:hypothetical protein